MLHATAFAIRHATDADADALRRLAALDSAAPLARPALIGEIDGRPAAAVSLADHRAVADPFQATGHLLVHLRVRAEALRTHAATPSLARRLRGAVRVAHAGPAAA